MSGKFFTETDRNKLIARLTGIPKENWIFKFNTIATCLDPDSDYDVAICSFMTEKARVWTEKNTSAHDGNCVRYRLIVDSEETDERTARKLFYEISNNPKFFSLEVENSMMKAHEELESFVQETFIIDEEPSAQIETQPDTPLKKLKKYLGDLRKAA